MALRRHGHEILPLNLIALFILFLIILLLLILLLRARFGVDRVVTRFYPSIED
jgi:hypothetical protein